MNETFIPEMFERVNKRLRAIEEQLALLSQHAGIPYTLPGADVPAQVKALAAAGQKLEAIKKYREITGASFDEANEVVSGI